MKEVFSYNLAESFKEVKASGNDLKNLVDQNLDQLEIYNRYVNKLYNPRRNKRKEQENQNPLYG